MTTENIVETSKAAVIRLDASWLAHLAPEFDKPYMQALKIFLQAEKNAGKIIYPPSDLWFNALDTTPFDRVKVVMLGQDPYHGPQQAHGLCFSVLPGIKKPPSLQNMFKELYSDLAIPTADHGCLTGWAQQGVLLLNSVLTVEDGNAGAHQGRGWETFTDVVIDALNRQRDGIVFMLWGSYAQKKGALIDRKRHLVLQAPHPSPLSAHRGFLGCKHFSQANNYLREKGKVEIDWRL
jgi:uracil-DNA glycosylase